jgi:hypothetical protein
MTNRAVPCTNNVSERHLRPSVSVVHGSDR